MRPSLQDEQTPVFGQLANALVEATPEWWTAGELVLKPSDAGLGSGLSHSISSDEYPRDIVVPTDEIFAATRELELTSVRHGDTWRRCVFRIMQEQSGEWRYIADFER